MPKGPQGQKRPADVIGNAVRVMQIATGEIAEDSPDPGKEYARKGGLIGGRKRASKLTPIQRSEIARVAAEARWKKGKSKS
jgi:hypothetical protein